MLLFDPLFFFSVITLYAWLPGAILGFSLLLRTKLDLLDKIMISLVIGLFFPPMLSFIEGIVGIQFSYTLAMINVGLTVLLGIIILILEFFIGVVGQIKINLSSFHNKINFITSLKNIKSLDDIKNRLNTLSHGFAMTILILILLATLITRMASWGPIYFELDPYYYIYGGEQLLKLGVMPLTDDTAWYPEVNTGHRYKPLLSFFDAHMYEYYTSGAEFDKYLYSTITSFYPPIAAMLLVFAMYLLIKTEYGHWYGVVAAFLTFTTPTLITKMMSGTMEAQPLALMALVFTTASYALMIKHKKWEYGLLTGFGILVAGWGATSLGLIAMVLATYVAIQGMLNFISGQKMNDFIKFNLLILLFIIFNDLVLNYYVTGAITLNFLLGSKILMLGGATVLCIILDNLNKFKQLDIFSNSMISRGLTVLGILSIGFILFLTPLANPVKQPLRSFLASATYTAPLTRTIQEQQLTGSLLTQWLGPLGSSLGPIDIITAIPSLIVKFSLAILNKMIAIIFNLPALEQQIGMILKLNPSLTLTFLLLAFITLVSEIIYRIYKGKTTEVSIPLLMGIYIFPVAFIGINKVKYMVYAAIGFVIATIIPFIGMARGINLLLKNIETDKIGWFVEKSFVHSVMFAILAAIALSTFLPLPTLFSQNATPPLSYSLLISSPMPKYGDNPFAVAPKFNELCIANLAYCGYSNPNPNMDINQQYDQNACFLSIIPNNELLSGNISMAWRYAASLRCSRIQDYWIDTYNWMEDNTPLDARITSWWDYGHWTNYFGDRKTVLRNEHASHHMIGMTAHSYLHGNERELWDYMNYFDSDYAMFDIDLIGSSNNMGGKYGALNYLGCAYANKTNVLKYPGESYCELNNLWDEIFVPQQGGEMCEYAPGEKGIIAYGYNATKITQNGFDAGERTFSKKYCIGKADVNMGNNITEINAVYSLDKKNDDGSLKLVRGFLIPEQPIKDQSGMVFNRYWLMFTHDKVWVVNNTLTSGWEDRTTKFYDSNFYKAFFLKQLDGFEKVYENKGVVVFKRLPEPPNGTPEIPAPAKPFPNPHIPTYK